MYTNAAPSRAVCGWRGRKEPASIFRFDLAAGKRVARPGRNFDQNLRFLGSTLQRGWKKGGAAGTEL